MSYRWVYHLHGSRLTSVLVWDHLCRTEPVKRVHTEPQMGKRSAAEACQDRRNTDTYAWKNAKNHSEIWDSNLLTKAVIHLVHVCPKAQLHAEQGTWTRARTSREHLPAPLSIWLTAARGGGSDCKLNHQNKYSFVCAQQRAAPVWHHKRDWSYRKLQHHFPLLLPAPSNVCQTTWAGLSRDTRPL